MKNPKVIEDKERLDLLFAKINDINEDDELKAHLVSYSCVRISGFIQKSIRAIVSEYAEGLDGSDEFLHWEKGEFTKPRIRDFQNPNIRNIRVLIRSFNRDWEIRVRSKLTDRMIAAITSVNSNRNQIAHGESAIISLEQLQSWYDDVVSAIEIIEEQRHSS